MLGFILGTSEGREILKMVNKYTDDVFISTFSAYGASLLKEYNYASVNSAPLTLEELKETLKANNVTTLVDASHPYASVITENSIIACQDLGIEYVRYERPMVLEREEYINNPNFIFLQDYEELKTGINFQGNILNSTGSNHMVALEELHLQNRIIHRILPTSRILQKAEDNHIPVENIIAMKGPFSKEMNKAMIKDYNIEGLLTKDSGVEGGTIEKVEAALECGIKVVVLARKKLQFENKVENVEQLEEKLFSK